MQGPRLTFDALPLMIAAAALAAAVFLIAWRRRVSLPAASKLLATIGLLLLVLAAGSPQWRRAVAGEVAVLVDLSPSTRTAAFRDRTAVEQRAKQLLGNVPFRIYRFADGPAVADAGSFWAELPSPITRYDPPPAQAVLLFSDGQFALPAAAPPTYAVIDPSLATAADGRVVQLAIKGQDALATVAVQDARSLSWTTGDATAAGSVSSALQPGRVVVRMPVNGAGAPVTARLSPGDPWPENDALTILPPPPPRTERWYVTTAATVPTGYRRLSPADLPSEAAAYLSTAVIVLDNIPATALPAVALDRLTQYVRDLGGGLVIVGGDRAFAAGGYVGTAIDALSPLASAPPRPATHWMLLTDGSGSMNVSAGDGGARTRWQLAAAALVRLLPSIPPDDPVDLGSFAADVNWWTGAAARPAKEVRSLPLPPAGITPGGPTNLRPAIEAAARRHDPALPGNLLVLSDADAEVGDLADLVELLKSRNVKLHLLAVGEGRGLADLRAVVEQTGGSVVRQEDADRWTEAAADLLRSAGDKRLGTTAVDVRFADALSGLRSRQVATWNRTWLKPRATLLAQASSPALASDADPLTPLAATWQLGEGRVAAMCFTANNDERSAAAELVAAPPRDLRINITIIPGPQLRVQINAVDPQAAPAERFLNGLALSLELSPSDGVSTPVRTEPIPQTAPGRYELIVPAPARPMLATIRDGERAVDRFAVAGRYPSEFDAIGINRQNLQQLAKRFGGAVIEPDQTKPIDFRWPLQATAIGSWLAAAGALMFAAALLWWRWA